MNGRTVYGSVSLATCSARIGLALAVVTISTLANLASAEEPPTPIYPPDPPDVELHDKPALEYYDKPESAAYTNDPASRGWLRDACDRVHCWMQDWHGGLDVGLNGSAGNSSATNLTAAFAAERVVGPTTQSLTANYFFTHDDTRTSANNLYARFRNERALAESNLNWYFDTWYLYNQFNDSFLGFSTGVSFAGIDNGTTRLSPRIGVGVPDLHFGIDFDHQLTQRQRIFGYVDYYPDSDFDDYRLNLHGGWELLLDCDTGLNMKIAAWDWYNGTNVAGAQPNDVSYIMSLGWTF